MGRGRAHVHSMSVLVFCGGIRGQTKVCVPKIGLDFPAPLINFILPEENFSGLARAPNNPPGSLSNSLSGRNMVLLSLAVWA